MLKILVSSLVLASVLFTYGCTAVPNISDQITPTDSSDNTLMNDKVKPELTIKSSEENITINKDEEYNLLTGVSGHDNLEGDITSRITVDIGIYDPSTPGEYMIKYNLKDSAGNEADPVKRTIVVKGSTIFTAPPIYLDAVDGEILNPDKPKLFGGAWYHKVVSSKDYWAGIEGTVTLPEVTIRRYDGDYNTELDVDPAFKNLDNPSVYMGGHATNESDVGLSFSRALIDVNSQTLSKGSIAFRPFWRYITSEHQDAGGYDAHDGEYAVSVTNNNCIANYHWKYTEYYYLPGDKLRIIINIPEPNKMQLQIEVIEKSTLPSSVEIRERYGWKDPADFTSPIFHSPGHGTGIIAEYKRVNAIDQVANEGGKAHPTESVVKNAIWHETYLYRKIDDVLYRIPMGDDRRGVLDAPDETKFSVSHEGVDRNVGGEVVTIHPGYEN